MIFYINSLSSKSSDMEDIFIVDTREEKVMTNTIVAKKGWLLTHEKRGSFTVHLEDGVIFISERDGESIRSIQFKAYDLKASLDEIIPSAGNREREPGELFLGELIERRRDEAGGREGYQRFLVEIMERFAMPFAVFFMGLVGAPLGAQVKSRGRLAGGVFGLLIFLVYYICLAGVQSMSEAAVLPPQVGPWIPVFLVASASLYLLRRASRGSPLRFLEAVLGERRSKGVGRGDAAPSRVNVSLPGQGTPLKEKEAALLPDSEKPRLPVQTSLVTDRVADTAFGRYVGNKTTKKYHSAECVWAQSMKHQDRSWFLRAEDAENAGYVPCKICKPASSSYSGIKKQ